MLGIKYSKPIGMAELEPSEGNAGTDLRANEDVIIASGQTAVVSTGLKMAIPYGYFGAVCSRSGLAAKNSIFVLNSPGIVDPNFRGEIKVILHNAGREPFKVHVGDRIAQLVLMTYEKPVFQEVVDDEITAMTTDRGENGFGSSGVK